MEISVIICTYNRDRYLYRTLESAVQNAVQACRYEIIVIDNNSTDHTVAEYKRFCEDYPDVTCRYFLETQQGLSYARNRGVSESKGEILLFIDDDAFMRKGYLNGLILDMEMYPDASAFGGKITPLYENHIIPKWMSKWTTIWVSAIDKGDRVCLFHGTSYPIGANMGFRREVIPKEGFNTSLGRCGDNLMGGEEKDLFRRIKAAGHKIFYFPDLEVRHVIPEKRTTYEYIRNLALGIGRSERVRTLGLSRLSYARRLLAEGVKWGASLLLYVWFLFRGQVSKGYALLYFRWYVTKGLVGEDLVPIG